MNADEQQAALEQLADLARRIEAHRAAVFLLKHERRQLYAKLRASGWKPPPSP